jgi:hypothetical protein
MSQPLIMPMFGIITQKTVRDEKLAVVHVSTVEKSLVWNINTKNR